MTLLAGFMMAESAEIGLLMGLVGSDMSMMTTWAVSPTFSRTQMYLKLETMHTCTKFKKIKSSTYLSDSIVRELNPMFAGVIPTFVSCKSYIFKYRSSVLFASTSGTGISGFEICVSNSCKLCVSSNKYVMLDGRRSKTSSDQITRSHALIAV